MMLGSSLEFSFCCDSDSSNKSGRGVQGGAGCTRSSEGALAVPAGSSLLQTLVVSRARSAVQGPDVLLGKGSGGTSTGLVTVPCQHRWKCLVSWALSLSVRLPLAAEGGS